MSIRSHMIEQHQHEAKKAASLSDSCGKLHECFIGMAKAASDSDAPTYSKIAGEFGKMAKTYSESADFHEAQCDTVKTEEDAMGKTIVPDHVRGTIPSNVPDSGFGFKSTGHRAVVRSGQPELMNKVALDGIDERFHHLVGAPLEDEV